MSPALARRGPAARSSARAIRPSRPLAEQVAELGYRAADIAVAAQRLPRRPRRDRVRTSWPPCRSGAPSSAVLVRAHGSLDAAIALLETGSARLAELDDDDDRIERLTGEREAAASALDDRAAALTEARDGAAGAARRRRDRRAARARDAGCARWRSR